MQVHVLYVCLHMSPACSFRAQEFRVSSDDAMTSKFQQQTLSRVGRAHTSAPLSPSLPLSLTTKFTCTFVAVWKTQDLGIHSDRPHIPHAPQGRQQRATFKQTSRGRWGKGRWPPLLLLMMQESEQQRTKKKTCNKPEDNWNPCDLHSLLPLQSCMLPFLEPSPPQEK